MMKKLISLFVIPILITCSVAIAGVDVYWDDGETHTIDDDTHWLDTIRLDSNVENSPGTHLNITGDGYVSSLITYNNSTATINCNIVNSIDARGNSTINLIQAWNSLKTCARDNATINISGGTIGSIYATDSSTIYMSGGTTQSSIAVRQDAVLYLDGTNFSMKNSEGDIISLSYGDKLSDYTGCYDDGTGLYYYGTIWGDFADGGFVCSKFRIYNTGDYEGVADIIIIPEPATLALLGIGGVLIRRKK